MLESATEAEGPPKTPPAAATPPAPARVLLGDGELGALSPGEWGAHWRLQDAYVTSLERRLGQQEGELEDLRQSTDKMRNQLNDSQQRERVLMRRLTAKEQETQDYLCQLTELKSAQAASATALRTGLLDPAVNCILQHLKAELQSARSKLDDTQNEMTAWKFTPDSNTGKRLMAKCHLLYQENEELGKITSSGRIAKLESDLALQKTFSEEVLQSQNELDSFLADLDEDVEAMQSTILFLQTELRKTKEQQQQQATAVAKENCVNGRSNGDSVLCEERTDCSTACSNLGETAEDSLMRTNCVKRVRRSSVLSIDYNDDDALVINTNGDVAMSSDPE